MNSLVSTQDFTINSDGVGFVSQHETSRVLGITQSSISRHVNKNVAIGYILNETNQLHEETFVLCIAYYARKGNIKAVDLLGKLARAGARAYIYASAGYQPKEQARIAELENAVALLSADRHRTEARAAVENAEKLKTVIHNQHATLQHWVAQGFLDCDAKTRTEYKYTLTEHGELHGFKQNRNGTVVPPEEWVA